MNHYRIHRAMLLGLLLATSTGLIAGDVLKYHLNDTRDGKYIDPTLTQSAARATHRDLTFSAPLTGPIYAQPLYVSNGPGGRAAFVVVTEQNAVVALDATNGSQIWTSTLGNPVPLSQQWCGNIDPLGITGTPVIDSTARALYVDALTTPDGGTTQRHLIFALSLDDGSTLAGWPLDVSGVITYSGMPFDSSLQNQRGALLLSGGILYVPYGGHWGDCGSYNGWVVAVPVNNPTGATAWATPGSRGGVWAPGGLASDGSSIFAATGNTDGATTWSGGEAIIRLGPGASSRAILPTISHRQIGRILMRTTKTSAAPGRCSSTCLGPPHRN
jgi:outer membrane protein assembly factor BamB